jgi:hypothetical protein
MCAFNTTAYQKKIPQKHSTYNMGINEKNKVHIKGFHNTDTSLPYSRRTVYLCTELLLLRVAIIATRWIQMAQ